jgi:phosphatidate cytidylyltransferase
MSALFDLPDPAVGITLAAILALLVAATAAHAILVRTRPQRDWTELGLRIRSWWAIVAIAGVALVLSPYAAIFFLACVSFVALKEYLSMVPTRRADRGVLFLAYLAIPIQLVWIGIDWYGMFVIFVPVYMFLIVPTAMVLRGETKGFLRAAGTVHWGLMQCVFAIGHAAYLIMLPGEGRGQGLLLFLVLATQLNDVAQYIWGRLFGRHRISPVVSPNKTVEGFVGGVATTVLVAAAAGPLLTPMSLPASLAAGVLIGVGGFIGDLSVSAIKRDIGVKDTGASIPGHGGVLDRIDSLTFTAPLFFHFIHYFYF